jgi:hypothetical protein
MKALAFIATTLFVFGFSTSLAVARSGSWTFQDITFERQVASQDKWHQVTCENTKSGETVKRRIILERTGEWTVDIPGTEYYPEFGVPKNANPEEAGKKFCVTLLPTGQFREDDGVNAGFTFNKINYKREAAYNTAKEYQLLCKKKGDPKANPKEFTIYMEKELGEWRSEYNMPSTAFNVPNSSKPEAVGKHVCGELVHSGGGIDYPFKRK